MCISKAYLSSKLLTLVWQQISSLYNSSFCAMIDLKALWLLFLWNGKPKPSKIYLSLQLIIKCFFLVLKFKKAEMVNCFWNIYIFYRNPSFKCLCNIVPVQKNYIWSLLLFFWCSENLVYINQYVKNETKFLWPMILFHIYKLMPVTYCKFVVAPGPFTIIFHLRFIMKFNCNTQSCTCT